MQPGILVAVGGATSHSFKCGGVVVAALGVYAAGILLLLGVGREPLFFSGRPLVAALEACPCKP